jgi:lysophospholipase
MFFKLLGVILALFFAVQAVRAQANASAAYTPTFGKCPPGFSLVRSASLSPKSPQILSPAESHYISSRKRKVLPGAWKSYLDNVKATKVPLPHYVSAILGDSDPSHKPTLGIATSGGGYRAAIFGAGVLNTLDGRNATSAKLGTGGLLQSASYLSGLSGGSWLVTSLAQADFPTFNELIFGSSNFSGWLAQFDVLKPTNDTQTQLEYAVGLVSEIKGKLAAGFHIGIADFFARGLSRHFVTGTTVANFFDPTALHGAGVTFSGIANL